MQKNAIKKAFINGISECSNSEPSEILKTIYALHVYNISKIDNHDIIRSAMAIDQNWRKLSNQAFEELISDMATPLLNKQGIKLILQSELCDLLNQNLISNQKPDLEWLRKQSKSSTFNFYLAIRNGESYKIYGSVQSRTSISDNETKDRQESIVAMKKFFMSVAIVLDGKNLENSIIKNTVNGSEFDNQQNGWHGMYVLSNKEIEIDRIHSIDVLMENFVKDVIEGAKFWTEQRQWFNHTWKPQR